jgi:uncharacterized protein involved in outer membrane biogenesis
MTETRKSPLRSRRGAWIAAGVTLAVVAGVAAGVAAAERAGWPFLAQPLERALSQRLGREVQLTEAGSAGFGIRLIGSVRLRTNRLQIAAPAWSQAPHLLVAHDARFEWTYGDLWRAWQGQALHTRRVQARSLDVRAERRANGEASWSLAPPEAGAAAPPAPTAGQLQLEAVTLKWDDIPARLTLTAEAVIDEGLRLRARGRYRDVPVQATVTAPSLDAPAALSVQASAGRVSMDFDGVAAALPRLDRLDGRFSVRGPSLAALGDPLGVTLPTTGPFRASGRLQRHPGRWDVEVTGATVGASALDGSFVYETDREVPLLSGVLRGKRLLLVDLGPVVGVAPAAETRRRRDKVLPDRPFDLAALRAMDARVDVDIAEVDLDVRRLEPLKPLRARLQLAGGVLVLADLDARTGQGKLAGSLHLDGRGDTALWLANLRWDGLRLEHWLRAEGSRGAARVAATPYATGRLGGRTSLRGRGLSTADILADLQGSLRSQLHEGAFSHLALEAAGLDLAQWLGVKIRGDEMLPVSCALADLTVERGVVKPRAIVLDTRDSVVSVDGQVSLASEALDLRLVVMPRDFSPLALRTPLRVQGSFAVPAVSVDKGRLAGKLAASVLLGLVNPLAALIPLVDPGDDAAATRGAAACRDLAERAANRRASK